MQKHLPFCATQDPLSANDWDDSTRVVPQTDGQTFRFLLSRKRKERVDTVSDGWGVIHFKQ